MTAPLPRSKVQQNQTWNAESVFESPAEFEAEVESILASLDSLKSFKGISVIAPRHSSKP